MSTVEQVIPLLVYDDIQAAHDFLVLAFGFEGRGVDRDVSGVPVHGEVRAGDSTIWLHRVTAEYELNSPRKVESVSGLVVRTSDVDAHYQKALVGGALIESEPRDMPYGQREYGARDPEGHRWWFYTSIDTLVPAKA